MSPWPLKIIFDSLHGFFEVSPSSSPKPTSATACGCRWISGLHIPGYIGVLTGSDRDIKTSSLLEAAFVTSPQEVPPPPLGSQHLISVEWSVMRPDQATTWYRRAAMMYALGTWTLVGSLYFFNRKQFPGRFSGRTFSFAQPKASLRSDAASPTHLLQN